MREQLLPLRDEVLGGPRIDDARFKRLVIAHREARNFLVDAAQGALGVHHRRNSSVVLRPFRPPDQVN